MDLPLAGSFRYTNGLLLETTDGLGTAENPGSSISTWLLEDARDSIHLASTHFLAVILLYSIWNPGILHFVFVED